MVSSDAPVSDLGENALVALLKERFPAAPGELGIGDDAAVFAPRGPRIVFTTDSMVEGVDFELSYFSGSDVGWKVIAINASDIAAMGGDPWKALITLCMPRSTRTGFVQDLIDGVVAAAEAMDVEIVGGDLSEADRIVVGAAALGTTDQAIPRSGARMGDAICVTGCFGGSSGGLALLQQDPTAEGPLVTRHKRPRPRLAEARVLRELRPSAMMDVSDGLVVDLDRLLVSSGKGCEVDPTRIPVDPALSVGDDRTAALFGGEDFELLLTLRREDVTAAASALESLGTRFSEIGVITEDEALIGGRPLSRLKEQGWDHLQSP
ncbi:MAG: thiamine-phosphate kinase [Actinomycetota bacterium]|nr:thiamine-phosphate kinase [Actinomycetota bacterium]